MLVDLAFTIFLFEFLMSVLRLPPSLKLFKNSMDPIYQDANVGGHGWFTQMAYNLPPMSESVSAHP